MFDVLPEYYWEVRQSWRRDTRGSKRTEGFARRRSDQPVLVLPGSGKSGPGG